MTSDRIAPKAKLLELLAQFVMQTQQSMVSALQQNAKAQAKLQILTVEALEGMADAITAPREINLTKDAKGKISGGKSIVIGVQNE